MNEELNNLINLALADGVVTEKERNIILKKAEKLGIDRDEAEMILDSRIQLSEKEIISSTLVNEKSTFVKEGQVKKCPSCGAPVKIFDSKCSDCEHQFINTEALSSRQKLFDKFEEIETEERARELGWAEKIDGELAYQTKINSRKASVIGSFPVPNSKADLLEFFSMAIAESKKSGGFHDDGVLRNAWKAKANDIHSNIQFDLKNDPHAIGLINEFNTSKKGFNISQKTKLLLIPLILCVVSFIGIGYGISYENEDKEKEFKRIEAVESKIENLISEKNYDAALIQVEKISWNESPRRNEKLVEKFDNERESLRATIHELALNNRQNQ